MLKPRMSSYDINALIYLWNRATDDFSRNRIKMSIVEKVLFCEYSIFYLINKFMYSKTELLKNVYADVILMKMKDNDYSFDEEIVIELLMYASLDTLMYYGTETLSYEFNNKCKDEFWKRAYEIENKIELKDKQNLDKKFILSLKKKGDKNDKY